MPPAYKLTYFNGRGAGESIRLLFVYGGIEFEDDRINPENWPKLKDSTPFGQLPLIEHNGKIINQSVAIARYVAKLVNLRGKNDWEDLEIDAVVDTIKDFLTKIANIQHEQDEGKKRELKAAAIKDTLPFYMSRFNDLAKRNNGFLAVDRLTWADMVFFTIIDIIERLLEKKSPLDDYPALKSLQANIAAIPSIKKWIETRPVTPF